jgi:hypothetical protein
MARRFGHTDRQVSQGDRLEIVPHIVVEAVLREEESHLSSP